MLAWAVAGDIEPATIHSNSFEIEWPPRSGQRQTFSEIDRGEWFTLDEGRKRINKGQVALLDALAAAITPAP